MKAFKINLLYMYKSDYYRIIMIEKNGHRSSVIRDQSLLCCLIAQLFGRIIVLCM